MLRFLFALGLVLAANGRASAEEPKTPLSVEWKTESGETMTGKIQGWKFDQKQNSFVLAIKSENGKTRQIPLKQLDKSTQQWFKNQRERLQAAERKLQQKERQLNAEKRKAKNRAQRLRRANKNGKK